jgi:hypothetical protein
LTRWKTAGAVPITAWCAPAKQKMQCVQPDWSGLLAGSAGRIVQAEFEGRSVLAGIRRQGEAADRDQQALDGDRIGDDNAQERSPETLACAVKSAHRQPTPGPIMKSGGSRVKCQKNDTPDVRRVCRHFGRMRMNACRRHSATSLLSWL